MLPEKILYWREKGGEGGWVIWWVDGYNLHPTSCFTVEFHTFFLQVIYKLLSHGNYSVGHSFDFHLPLWSQFRVTEDRTCYAGPMDWRVGVKGADEDLDLWQDSLCLLFRFTSGCDHSYSLTLRGTTRKRKYIKLSTLQPFTIECQKKSRTALVSLYYALVIGVENLCHFLNQSGSEIRQWKTSFHFLNTFQQLIFHTFSKMGKLLDKFPSFFFSRIQVFVSTLVHYLFMVRYRNSIAKSEVTENVALFFSFKTTGKNRFWPCFANTKISWNSRWSLFFLLVYFLSSKDKVREKQRGLIKAYHRDPCSWQMTELPVLCVLPL